MLLPVGALLGERFTVEALLTSNAATAMYRARDLSTGEAAVLRVIAAGSTEASDASLLQHLDRMAPLLARVRHRNIGRYLLHGRTPDGEIFFASALPPGESATARLLTLGSADAAGALRILRDGTAALAYLHALGIVHGAVRPANLLVPPTRTEPCTLLLDVSCAREGDLIEDAGTLNGPAPAAPRSAAEAKVSAPLRREQDVTELGQIALAWLLGERGLRDRLPEPLVISEVGITAHEVTLLERSLRAVFAQERSARVAEAAALRSLLLGPDPASTTDRTSAAPPQVIPEAATFEAPAGTQSSSHSLGDVEDPLIGTTLEGRYLIEVQLGSGGMGVVYRARHLILGTPLAVKLLHGAPRGAAYVQRFLREAQLASRIQHPNTVYISDFGIAALGQPFLVMELVAGRTLRRLILDEPLDPIRACRIAAQIAHGMQAIHDKGIVHRDLKPENIFVLSSGPGRDFVKIVDFGLAKELVAGGAEEGAAPASAPASPRGEGDADEATADTRYSRRTWPQPAEPVSPRPSDAGSPQQTATGALVGTPRYMSPEQAAVQVVDARADQYALGCILYELLTGVPPFMEARLNRLLAMHISSSPEPPRTRAPQRGISASLEALTLRLLAKLPASRFSSMGEVADALEREAAELTRADEVRPPGASSEVRGSRERGPQRAAIWLLGSALALSLTGGALWLRSRMVSRAASVVTEPEVAELSRQALRTIDEVLQDALNEVRRGAEPARLVRLIADLAEARAPQLAERLLPLLADPLPAVRAEAARTAATVHERSLGVPLRRLLAEAEPAAVRLAAAAALDSIGDDAGTAALHEWLARGSSSEARIHAALRLCRRGEARALTELRAALAPEGMHPGGVTRLQLLTCLAGNGDAEARATLRIEAAHAATVPLQLAAAAQLVELGDPAGTAVLRAAMSAASPYTLAAAHLLAGPSEEAAVQACRAVVRRAPADPASLVTALLGLAAGGDPADARSAAAWLGSGTSAEVRIAAAAATLRLVSSAPSLLTGESLRWARLALADSSWQVRLAAAEILSDIESPESVVMLAKLSRDPIPAVRAAAVRSLAAHPLLDALELIAERARDSSAEVRWEALRSLGLIVAELRRLRLFEMVEHGLKRLREVAVQEQGADAALAAAVLSRLGEGALSTAQSAALRSAPAALRRLVLDELAALPGWLSTALGDGDFAVRFAAAQRLAERGEPSALGVLREASRYGGFTAALAEALRAHLGDPGVPGSAQVYSPGAPLWQRLAALSLPAQRTGAAEGAAVLRLALHDPSAEVRRLVAHRAARAGDTALLLLLQSDPDATVRAQVQAQLGSGRRADAAELRDRGVRELAERLANPRSDATPAAAPDSARDAGVPDAGRADGGSPTSEAVPPAPAATGPSSGSVRIAAAPGTLFRIDDGPWNTPGAAALPLTAGEHRITALETTQTFSIAAGAISTVTLTPSATDLDLGAAMLAAQRGSYLAARRRLDAAEARCRGSSAATISKAACRAVLIAVAYQRARLWESQHFLPEAMQEYQRLIQPAARGDAVPAQRAAAMQAATRLERELGRILTPEQRGGRCVIQSFWVMPGGKTLVVHGTRQTVKVRAGETVKVGDCQ